MFGKFARGGIRVPEGGFMPKFNAPPSESIRPCLANGKPARFHRWVDEDKALLRINAFVREDERARLHRAFLDDGIVQNSCTTEVLRATFALVEYRDGTVEKVKPELIRFLDPGEA